jgi:hypothetical protein
MADTAMRRLVTEAMERLPAEHRAHMATMMREAPAAKPAPKPAPKPADPHAGHGRPPAAAARPAAP